MNKMSEIPLGILQGLGVVQRIMVLAIVSTYRQNQLMSAVSLRRGSDETRSQPKILYKQTDTQHRLLSCSVTKDNPLNCRDTYTNTFRAVIPKNNIKKSGPRRKCPGAFKFSC